MKEELKRLTKALKAIEPEVSGRIQVLAGRYDKAPVKTPPEMQPAYKYIMYLKLMKGLDDPTFHHMKRKYLNTSPDIQQECREELDKIINRDSLESEFSSAEIRRSFEEKLKRARPLLDHRINS